MAALNVLALQLGHAMQLVASLAQELGECGELEMFTRQRCREHCENANGLIEIVRDDVARAVAEQAANAARRAFRVESNPHRWTGDTCEDCGALRNGVLSRLRCGITRARPTCPHSACAQNWIETGDAQCVEACPTCGVSPSFRLNHGRPEPACNCGLLSDADRAQAAEASGRA